MMYEIEKEKTIMATLPESWRAIDLPLGVLGSNVRAIHLNDELLKHPDIRICTDRIFFVGDDVRDWNQAEGAQLIIKLANGSSHRYAARMGQKIHEEWEQVSDRMNANKEKQARHLKIGDKIAYGNCLGVTLDRVHMAKNGVFIGFTDPRGDYRIASLPPLFCVMTVKT